MCKPTNVFFILPRQTDIVVTELDAETLKPKCTLEQIVCHYDGVSAGGQTPEDVCVREAIAA